MRRSATSPTGREFSPGEDLAELITYVVIEKALLRAAEADGAANDEGVFLPKWETLNAARNWYPRKVSQRLPGDHPQVLGIGASWHCPARATSGTPTSAPTSTYTCRAA